MTTNYSNLQPQHNDAIQVAIANARPFTLVDALGKSETFFGRHLDHSKDSDCIIDPETLCCAICGIDHSDECLDCGGRGFHKPTCEWAVAA